VSFTGVVGYQTKSSTIARASPLFSVRSKRALDKESKDLTCDYVGKGEGINIPLPTRNSKGVSFDRLVDTIKRMDDKSFDKFVKRVIANINQNNKINGIYVSNEEIEFMLYQLRDNSEAVKKNYMMIKDNDLEIITIQIYQPWCWFVWLFGFFKAIIIAIIMLPFGILCAVTPVLPTTS